MGTRRHDPFSPVRKRHVTTEPVTQDDAPADPPGLHLVKSEPAVTGASAPDALVGSGEPADDGLDELTRAELVAYAKERGVPYYGTRAAILARIRGRS